jgi:HAD superfamily phosphatase
VVLFDIDGVIRDVSGSYRRAIVETVHHYGGWRPDPAAIDALKGEGLWNNDWQASRELLRRGGVTALPELGALAAVFGRFYFGGDPEGDPEGWQGFIRDEPLLVDAGFFSALTAVGVAWGFVSGAEPPSVRFVLEQRLGLVAPPRIAMGEAPDKPDPTGLLRLAGALLAPSGLALGPAAPPVVYVGDTVADVQTVARARQQEVAQSFLSVAVAPPHLHGPQRRDEREAYEARLRAAGADRILTRTADLLEVLREGSTSLSAPSPPVP